MTPTVSPTASTALQWAFGPYADKPPMSAWEVCRVAEMEVTGEITEADIDALAERLIHDTCVEGLAGRIAFGWCTYQREGKFGLGVMAFGRRER